MVVSRAIVAVMLLRRKLMGVLQVKPMHIFSPNLQDMFDLLTPRANLVLDLTANNFCDDNSLKISGISTLWMLHRYTDS